MEVPTKTNGESTSTLADRPGGPRPPEHGIAAPTIWFASDLFQHGGARAAASGALSPDDKELAVLEENARAMARETHRAAYDPAKRREDRIRERECQ